MANGDGLDALRSIKREQPQSAVVMLTSYESPTYIARAVAGGAAGYLLKGLRRAELMRSLRGLGEETQLAASDLIHPLSEREIDVLRFLATGLGNREIGELLIRERKHRQNARRSHHRQTRRLGSRSSGGMGRAKRLVGNGLTSLLL